MSLNWCVLSSYGFRNDERVLVNGYPWKDTSMESLNKCFTLLFHQYDKKNKSESVTVQAAEERKKSSTENAYVWALLYPPSFPQSGERDTWKQHPLPISASFRNKMRSLRQSLFISFAKDTLPTEFNSTLFNLLRDNNGRNHYVLMWWYRLYNPLGTIHISY